MRREHGGFSLVELMISMVMFLLVISATTQFFSSQFDQFKRQSRIAESSVEGIIGLEMMRVDISHAGFGLPWQLSGAAYLEAVDDGTPWVDSDFNDAPPGNPARPPEAGNPASNPPGAVRSGNTAVLTGTTLYDSDVLVLKASNVAQNAESQKWTRVGLGDVKRADLSGYDFQNTDRIIVLSPADRIMQLSSIDSAWSTTYNDTLDFEPTGERINIIYGINGPPAALPRFPFNRTEYYIRIPATMPSGCAVGTGVLYRSTLNHAVNPLTGSQHTESPILDCVADLQVVYTDNNDISQDESHTFDMTAKEIRDSIRSVTVYILAHEGQRDPNFDLEDSNPDGKIMVGPNPVLGREYDFKTAPTNNIDDWQNYRWKVYTVSSTLHNLN